MVVDFAASRARACSDCHNACENACPMRLKPRNLKRHMFTCTQCAQCISACEATQEGNLQGTLLLWSGSGNLSKKSLRGRKADKETHQGEQNETGEHS
jgi:dissimilatory sulfite reductase (desulfoviridin) alpha/beta subunit